MSSKFGIRMGAWLFRFRSFTPLPMLILCLILFRPASSVGCPVWLMWTGVAIALFGEWIRILAVGWSFGGTSGREAYLRADQLNTTGVYAVARNPLYIGNITIFLGLTMLYGNVWVTALMTLFMAGQYILIVAAEEVYLLGKYGQAYQKYCQQTTRFLPMIHRFRLPEHSFSWQKVLLKENDSLFNMGIVAFALLHYRFFILNDRWLSFEWFVFPLIIWIGLYALIKIHKKRVSKK